MFTNPISQRIYLKALSNGMPELLARFITGQAYHESGQYKGKFATKYNSYFGYSFDKNSKWQSAPGSLADNGAKIAGYASLEDSVSEMTDWIKRRVKQKRFPDLGTITTPLMYAQYLYKCGYFQGWKKYTPEQNISFYAKGIESVH